MFKRQSTQDCFGKEEEMSAKVIDIKQKDNREEENDYRIIEEKPFAQSDRSMLLAQYLKQPSSLMKQQLQWCPRRSKMCFFSQAAARVSAISKRPCPTTTKVVLRNSQWPSATRSYSGPPIEPSVQQTITIAFLASGSRLFFPHISSRALRSQSGLTLPISMFGALLLKISYIVLLLSPYKMRCSAL